MSTKRADLDARRRTGGVLLDGTYVRVAGSKALAGDVPKALQAITADWQRLAVLTPYR